jgi:release factor glutamine methyltransferase
VAKINASLHQVKDIKFFHSNLFDNIKAEGKFDIIISNPPYISNAEYENISPLAKSQPREALLAEKDGYLFYQKIFQQARSFLEKKFLLMIEIGHRQSEKVVKLVIEYFSQTKVSIFPDWESRSRAIGIYQF